jgi:hypothetical protein
MHTPWLLVAHHIEYFDTQENIDKFLFKRKRRLKKKRKRNRNRKKKKENPPSAGLDSAQPPPLSPTRSSPRPKPSTPHLPRPRSRHAAVRPAPPASHTYPSPLAFALSRKRAPPVSPFCPSPVTRLSTRSPPAIVCPIASPLTRSPARFGIMRLRALCSSRPFTPACPSRPVATMHHHHRRGKLTGARHLSSLPPPRPPIKGPPRAPCSTTRGLSHSTSLPRTQSSLASSSLPAPVSSALLSLVSYGQIALALKLHLYVASLAHTSSSPIAPDILAGDFTAAGTLHLAMDQPSRASTGQIDPTSVIPYLRSCLSTIPSTQNRTTSEEPPRTAFPPSDVVTPLLPLTRGPTSTVPSPQAGQAGPRAPAP